MKATTLLARVAFLLLLGASPGCGQDRIHEGDHAANFERVFREPPPPGVEVVNSIVAEYRWRLGTVSTDDWEFEIVAPRAWIDDRARKMHLAPARDNPFIANHVAERKTRARKWYAPEPLDTYEVFYLTPTSIPYVHMLIERRPQRDGRYKVYLSKH